jgi:hypothetical protein
MTVVWTPVLAYPRWLVMTNTPDSKSVQLVLNADILTLADELSFQKDRDVLLDFIMEIDTRVAEEEFTVELIRRLKESLEEDEPVDSATMQDIRGRLNNVLSAIHSLDNAING